MTEFRNCGVCGQLLAPNAGLCPKCFKSGSQPHPGEHEDEWKGYVAQAVNVVFWSILAGAIGLETFGTGIFMGFIFGIWFADKLYPIYLDPDKRGDAEKLKASRLNALRKKSEKLASEIREAEKELKEAKEKARD